MNARRADNPAAARRREQLRDAKRAQRARDREAGLALCQLKLRPATAAALRRAVAVPGFEDRLAEFLSRELVDAAAFPNLRLLCWNRADRLMTARDAFALYERNWRFVDQRALEPHERALIERLAREYGNGVING
jgi:hypothetical protein